MKHRISRSIELTEDEIRQAICYWLKEFCDKPAPEDRDAVNFVYNEDTGVVRGIVAWAEDIPES